MNLRSILVLALSLLCAPALAQVTPGTTPLSIAKGGTNASTASTARTSLGLGSIATQNSNAVAITGGTITGLPTPVNPADTAIKSYVDGLTTGLIILPQVSVATTAVLPNTPTYANGTSGVGATLTAGANSTLTVDGVVSPPIVLVKNQASSFQNGIYSLTTVGSGAAAWVLTRAINFDQSAEMLAGSYVFVTSGSANINSSYVLQSTVTTVGTTAVIFNQFASSLNAVLSLGGATGNITLGTGLQMSSNTLGPVLGASLQTGALTPGSVTSTTGLMTGLGLSGCTITPTVTGRVHLEIAGYISIGTVGIGTTSTLQWGTGTAPSHNGASAGTQLGSPFTMNSNVSGEKKSLTMTGNVTGQALGTAIWFDAKQSAGAGAVTLFAACNANEY